MKKVLSYVWPFTKKYNTQHSGVLEVTWFNGKKVLDSKNANYSYGSLEKVLDHGLSHSHADRSSKVLVLGLGGGSVIDLLRKKYLFKGKITAVEIDPQIIEIARTEFNVDRHVPLELACEDAYEFVKRSTEKYGLVIIDIFIDVAVPPRFFSTEFMEHIAILLAKDGEVIFNTGIYSANDHEASLLIKKTRSIKFRKLDHVNGTNTLLIGVKVKKVRE